MIKLEPCPFCGSENIQPERYISSLTVECYDCEASGPPVEIESTWGEAEYKESTKEQLDAAIHRVSELWNKRQTEVKK